MGTFKIKKQNILITLNNKLLHVITRFIFCFICYPSLHKSEGVWSRPNQEFKFYSTITKKKITAKIEPTTMMILSCFHRQMFQRDVYNKVFNRHVFRW